MAHVIVCGLGQVGFRVVSLLRRLDAQVSVVTMDPREEFREIAEEMGAKVVLGDARADKHLIAAGIRSADSLIACVDDDLTNIEIALDAARMNPKCKVTVRLFDQQLGRRLEESIGIRNAMAMSVISAPAFASAALDEQIRGSFAWRGETYLVIGPVGSPERAELLLQMGAKKVQFEAESERLICSRSAYMKAMGKQQPRRPKHPAGRLKNAWMVLKLFVETTPKALRSVALVILGLTIMSVAVFQLGMHLSWSDALYFVITTVTTTGYGDITPKDAGLWLKLYGCFMMLLGSAAVATLYSIITDFVVAVRFDEVLGRHRAASTDHVIVVGIGNVGYHVVMAIKALGADVVAVDANANTEYRGMLNQIPFVSGDARDPETLALAGIERASAIVSVTDDDAVNLSVGLTAKSVNPDVRTVLRLFDGDLAAKIQASMNVDAALSASRIAAPSFVGSAHLADALFCYVSGDSFVALREPASGEDFEVSVSPLKPSVSSF